MPQSSLAESVNVKKQNFVTTQTGSVPNIGIAVLQKAGEENIRGAHENAEIDASGVSGPLGTQNRLE
jgi:hypothetical protein